MGEHTIREILKRRSPETQRAMQRRRELAQGGAGASGFVPRLVLVLLVPLEVPPPPPHPAAASTTRMIVGRKKRRLTPVECSRALGKEGT